MPTNYELGVWGEEQAARFLRRKGYRIVAVRFRCPYGEIDLIARNRTFLAFVEVKLRKTAEIAQAMEFVDRRKQNRLRMTAAFYLARYPTGLQPRFDVIEVYAPAGMETARPEIHHIEDAFE